MLGAGFDVMIDVAAEIVIQICVNIRIEMDVRAPQPRIAFIITVCRFRPSAKKPCRIATAAAREQSRRLGDQR